MTTFFSTCPVVTKSGASSFEWMNFLLARVAKLVAHARFLKSTILIKIGDMFVRWILKGRKCDKSTKPDSDTHTHKPTSPQSYINL